MVRDEADVIEGMIRHLADEVDRILVADNGSTDGTRKILDGLARELPVEVVDDDEVAYHQSAKMTGLAVRAADEGATWIVPVDADELWVCHEGRIRDVLAGLPDFVNIADVRLWNHFATALDPAGDNPFETMVWHQRQPGALGKVLFRWSPGATIHQGNHGVSLEQPAVNAPGRFEIRHFPYRSPDQMVRKARNGAAAYRASDLPADFGAHWRAYGDLIDRHGEEALHDVFRRYFWHLSPTDADMILDPAPYLRWQQQS